MVRGRSLGSLPAKLLLGREYGPPVHRRPQRLEHDLRIGLAGGEHARERESSALEPTPGLDGAGLVEAVLDDVRAEGESKRTGILEREGDVRPRERLDLVERIRARALEREGHARVEPLECGARGGGEEGTLVVEVMVGGSGAHAGGRRDGTDGDPFGPLSHRTAQRRPNERFAEIAVMVPTLSLDTWRSGRSLHLINVKIL